MKRGQAGLATAAITSEVFFNEVDEQALPALAAASESLFDLFTEIKRN